MDHFQELSLQRAPSARQHIQNPAAEHETQFSLISQNLVFITLKSGTAFFITSLSGSGFTFVTVSHLRALTDKSTTRSLYSFGLHVRNGSSQRSQLKLQIPASFLVHTSKMRLFYGDHLSNVWAASGPYTVPLCFINTVVFLTIFPC